MDEVRDAAPTAEARQRGETERVVRRYLERMGFGEAAIAVVLPLCIARASKRVGRGHQQSVEELHRRAVEDVQRRLDKALCHLLGIAADDLAAVARARAAFLLAGDGFPRDALFTGDSIPQEAVQRLAAALPLGTPPEAPRPMAHQSFSYFLRR